MKFLDRVLLQSSLVNAPVRVRAYTRTHARAREDVAIERILDERILDEKNN